ncbi:hypothetical protein O7626_24220 [Micromonospora sp. WMMD1102]|uniref:hypothetical protein n=1 Tax=Micromonospora sp. WMMD1102 TaxID=3016105 RepID=UPI00241508A6|nr:hypothetical protein [Micromonospora sp. WMMD1102]MDG4788998.1 hypothetical protein [Micromonospora sp. WMMD1102]
MIRWQDHRDRVERAVKLLIRDLHPTAQGIDGSGGDDGRDIRWDSPDGLVIFEVKSYTDRLGASQKRGIRNSLKKAAKHNPIRWVLVVPLESSPSEEKWFDGLRAEFPALELEWRGRDWLDKEFAEREDLIRYVEGPLYVLAQRAKELGHEQAAMANGIRDAIERLGVFSARVNELSPYWRIDVATRPGGYMLTYSAKRPDSAEVDPISITPIFSFDAKDPEAEGVSRQLRRVLEYGGSITVPGDYIQGFDIHASEETRRAFAWDWPITPHKLEIHSEEDNAGLPLPCVIDVKSPNGSCISSIAVQLSKRVRGSRGFTLSGQDLSGMMTLNLLTGKSEPAPTGAFEFEISSPVGLFPYAVRPVADFIRALVSGNRVEFRMGHRVFGFCEIDEDVFPEGQPAARLAIALDELQQFFNMVFPIPDGLGAKDLRELEMLRELVREGEAQWPYRGLKMHFRRDRLGDFLADPRFNDGAALLARFDSFGMEYCGNRFELGHVQFYAPKMRLVNRKELAAEVGKPVDPEGRWECLDGEHIRIRRLAKEEREPSLL